MTQSPPTRLVPGGMRQFSVSGWPTTQPIWRHEHGPDMREHQEVGRRTPAASWESAQAIPLVLVLESEHCVAIRD